MTTKTITTDRPITLHGLCHVSDSFCGGIELCSIPYQNLVPEKTWYQIDRHTCKSLVPDDCYQSSGTSFCDVCCRLYNIFHYAVT